MKVKFNMQMYIYNTQIDTIELCMHVPNYVCMYLIMYVCT